VADREAWYIEPSSLEEDVLPLPTPRGGGECPLPLHPCEVQASQDLQ
jgi:hypothetical protein